MARSNAILAPLVVALAVLMNAVVVVVDVLLLPVLVRTAGRMVLVPIPVLSAIIRCPAIRTVRHSQICKVAVQLKVSGFPPDAPGLL